MSSKNCNEKLLLGNGFNIAFVKDVARVNYPNINTSKSLIPFKDYFNKILGNIHSFDGIKVKHYGDEEYVLLSMVMNNKELYDSLEVVDIEKFSYLVEIFILNSTNSFPCYLINEGIRYEREKAQEVEQ